MPPEYQAVHGPEEGSCNLEINLYNAGMVERALRQIVEARLARYPAVTIVGPRQSGKTTLACAIGGTYFDLEQESDRLRLDLEWPSLMQGRGLVVLDEAQAAPEVFPRLRSAVDLDRKRNGRFLLLGSVSPALMSHVSQSLAGRLSVVELRPFVMSELPEIALDELWLRGGYPDGGVLHAGAYPQWQVDYLRLLAQRDFPVWGLPARPTLTERLLSMTAAVHGQILNSSQLGQSLSVSYHTASSYLEFLIGAFLVRLLRPYQKNLSKRLTKRPRLYWRDSGLLHALLNVADPDDLLRRPWVGASWEGFVLEQILASVAHHDMQADPYFFRTSDGHEIDLVLVVGRKLVAVEVKLTTNPASEDMGRLDQAANLIGADVRILLSRTPQSVTDGKRISCDLPWLLEHLEEIVTL